MTTGAPTIDFVITWVDGSDENWLRERARFLPDQGVQNMSALYRDWGILKYWFRAVEQFAPWVNQIHFVTWGHLPSWLRTDHPKLHIVRHQDYIPAEYLPTFSSHPIELNLHRIPGLSEQFVYFNDDMVLTAPIQPDDFFLDGLPRDSFVMSALTPSLVNDPFVHYLCNDMAVINTHFRKKAVLKKQFSKIFSLKYGKLLFKNLYYSGVGNFTGFHNFHMPAAYLKRTFEAVWEQEPEILAQTSSHRFRERTDVNPYVFTYWQLCSGDFVPRKPTMGKMYTIGENEALYGAVADHLYRMLCINDTIREIDFEAEKQKLTDCFERAYPNPSSFEK